MSVMFNDIVITATSRMDLLLNHHFVNATQAFTVSDPDMASTDLDNMASLDLQPSPSSNTGFSFISLSISEVQDEFTKVDPNKSAGLEGLDPMFLKAALYLSSFYVPTARCSPLCSSLLLLPS